MKVAKFDQDGVALCVAEIGFGKINDDSYVEVPENAEVNGLFRLNDGTIVTSRDELTLDTSRTVIYNDGKDSAVISGLPSDGCLLNVNGSRVVATGSTYSVTSTGDTYIVEAIGAYRSNVVTIRAGTKDDIQNDIRNVRDGLLAASDWTQMSDAALTDEQKLAWANYRTALRNITDDQPTATIDTVIWPSKP